jgi:hypothetical protein
MDLTNDVINRLNGVMPTISLQLAPPEGGILSQFPRPVAKAKHKPAAKSLRPPRRMAKPLKKRCDKACAARLARVTPVHGRGK